MSSCPAGVERTVLPRATGGSWLGEVGDLAAVDDELGVIGPIALPEGAGPGATSPGSGAPSQIIMPAAALAPTDPTSDIADCSRAHRTIATRGAAMRPTFTGRRYAGHCRRRLDP